MDLDSPPTLAPTNPSPARAVTKWVATAIGASIIGALVAGYFSRSRPTIQLTDVKVEKQDLAADADIPQVPIPKELLREAHDSLWFPNLEEKESLNHLKEEQRKLQDKLLAVEGCPAFVGKALRILRTAGTSDDRQKAYLELVQSTDEKVILTAKAMVKVLVQEGKVSLDDARAPSESPSPDPSAEFLEDYETNGRVHAFIDGTRWQPERLISALEAITAESSEQLSNSTKLNRDLQQAISDFEKAAIENIRVNAIATNSGKTPIALDRYAVLAISGFQSPFFLISDQKGGIGLAPGSSAEVTYRTFHPVGANDSETLHALYEKDIVKCRLTTRALTRDWAVGEWVSTPTGRFGAHTAKLEAEFVAKAGRPD